MYKIASVVDVKGWAYDNIAKNIKPFLADKYQFSIFYRSELSLVDLIETLFFKEKYDLVFIFWRLELVSLFQIEVLIAASFRLGVSVQDIIERISKTPIAFGVYDHGFLSEGNVINNQLFRLNKNFFVSSNILRDIYSSLLNRSVFVIEDGVNLNTFFKTKDPGLDLPLRVGWVGNSKWGEGIINNDPKGYHSILVPALEALKRENVSFELHLADKNTKFIPREKMNEFYNNIDVLVCTSLCEGTPNPVLEAMAAGRAILATDVGIVSQVLGESQRSFIVSRTPEAFADQLKKMNYKETLQSLADENIARIKEWSWENKAVKWDIFFMDVMERHSSTIEQERMWMHYLSQSIPSSRALLSTRKVIRMIIIEALKKVGQYESFKDFKLNLQKRLLNLFQKQA